VLEEGRIGPGGGGRPTAPGQAGAVARHGCSCASFPNAGPRQRGGARSGGGIGLRSGRQPFPARRAVPVPALGPRPSALEAA
jgi:hypothetical protein